MQKFLTSIEKETLNAFDILRGDVPRSAYVRRMIKNEVESVHGRILQDSTMNGTAQINNHMGVICND